MIGPERVLRLVNGLVEHSLLTVTHQGRSGTRYALLEPVRVYAADLLKEQGEAEAVEQAFSAYYLAYLEQAAPKYWGPDQLKWQRRTEDEAANIRAAMAGALARRDGDTAARMCWALWPAWWRRGRLVERQQWVSEALRHPMTPYSRSRALWVGAVARYVESDFRDALEWWSRAADCAEESGDPICVAYGVAGRGLALLSLGRLDEAEQAFREGLRIAVGEGVDWLTAPTRIWLGTLLLGSVDAQGSLTVFEGAIESARRRGDRLAAYAGPCNLATASLALGNERRTRNLFPKSVALSHENRDAANLALALDGLAVTERHRSRRLEEPLASPLPGARE